eukprot:m.58132 g.58132  ORF g.58132 m.58132 type:complete len:66 (-) comp13125_c0_seq2:15-212(-)
MKTKRQESLASICVVLPRYRCRDLPFRPVIGLKSASNVVNKDMLKTSQKKQEKKKTSRKEKRKEL